MELCRAAKDERVELRSGSLLSYFILVVVTLLLILGGWTVWAGITYLEIGGDYPHIWRALLGWYFLSLLGPVAIAGVLLGAIGRGRVRQEQGAPEGIFTPKQSSTNRALSVLGVLGHALLAGLLYVAVWFGAVRWGSALLMASVAMQRPWTTILIWMEGLALAVVLSVVMGGLWRTAAPGK